MLENLAIGAADQTAEEQAICTALLEALEPHRVAKE